MSSPADTPSSVGEQRWWGRPLAETRWQLELARLLVDPVLRGHGVPRGDGRPVVLLPGFLAGDQTLLVLAAWLRHIGYHPSTCGFVANVQCSDRAIERVERHVEQVAERHGRRVSVIGHSRGGHYARAIGARRPELVSHAVSMGAGLTEMLAISYPTEAAVGAVRRAQHRTHRARSPRCLTESCDCPFAQDFTRPFPSDDVRLTSIYSRGDGVVRWQAAIAPDAECVEVAGSHVGLVFNRKAYHAVAVALAAPELAAHSH
jgi:pimeloyl-ACP methyl ester carboxylesterase